MNEEKPEKVMPQMEKPKKELVDFEKISEMVRMSPFVNAYEALLKLDREKGSDKSSSNATEAMIKVLEEHSDVILFKKLRATCLSYGHTLG